MVDCGWIDAYTSEGCVMWSHDIMTNAAQNKLFIFSYLNLRCVVRGKWRHSIVIHQNIFTLHTDQTVSRVFSLNRSVPASSITLLFVCNFNVLWLRWISKEDRSIVLVHISLQIIIWRRQVFAANDQYGSGEQFTFYTAKPFQPKA